MITYESFFKAVAEVMKEEGIKIYGPLGEKYPSKIDVMGFDQWVILAERLGLERPKVVTCECCNQIIGLKSK